MTTTVQCVDLNEPIALDLKTFQGETWDFEFTYVDGLGRPVSFVGCAGVGHVKSNSATGGNIATITVTFPDAANGKVRLSQTAAESDKVTSTAILWSQTAPLYCYSVAIRNIDTGKLAMPPMLGQFLPRPRL